MDYKPSLLEKYVKTGESSGWQMLNIDSNKNSSSECAFQGVVSGGPFNA